MQNTTKISEYIDNLTVKKRFCKGFHPDDVYNIICDLTSMYNEVLAEAYEENDMLKEEIKVLKAEKGYDV